MNDRSKNLRAMAGAIERNQSPLDDVKRSELTLLYQLIKRNPERAAVFLERLKESVCTTDNVVV